VVDDDVQGDVDGLADKCEVGDGERGEGDRRSMVGHEKVASKLKSEEHQRRRRRRRVSPRGERRSESHGDLLLVDQRVGWFSGRESTESRSEYEESVPKEDGDGTATERRWIARPWS